MIFRQDFLAVNTNRMVNNFGMIVKYNIDPNQIKSQR